MDADEFSVLRTKNSWSGFYPQEETAKKITVSMTVIFTQQLQGGRDDH
jgi:hypothetical protein